MSRPTGSAARKRLEALVGTWRKEAEPPDGPPWPGEAWVVFEWLDGAPLLIGRWHADLPEAPDGLTVVGCDALNGTYYELYTDDRDVQRIYAMSLDGGVWRRWRDGAPFAQRFTGTFSQDGRSIAGRHEIAEDGQTWRTDFDVRYTKVAQRARERDGRPPV